MQTILLNAAVAVLAIAVVLGIWISVHLMARRRVGERKLGCKGPVPTKEGGVSCCSQAGSCDRAATNCAVDGETPQDIS